MANYMPKILYIIFLNYILIKFINGKFRYKKRGSIIQVIWSLISLILVIIRIKWVWMIKLNKQ